MVVCRLQFGIITKDPAFSFKKLFLKNIFGWKILLQRIFKVGFKYCVMYACVT